MSRRFSYTDAVRILGGQNTEVVNAFDKTASVALFASAAAGFTFMLGLFEAKSELVRLGADLIAGIAKKMRRGGRLAKSERIAAAHTVIIVTAFFDALSQVNLPFNPKDLDFTRTQQVYLATSNEARSHDLVMLAADLLNAEIPIPAPNRPYEDALEELLRYYEGLAHRTADFIAGLFLWDELDETRRNVVFDAIAKRAPLIALASYEHLIRRLAVEFPEVAYWQDRVDHQATRVELRELRTSIDSLERVITAIRVGTVSDDRLARIARSNRAILDEPILEAGEIPAGDLQVPSLQQAYINPRFRVAKANPGSSDRPDLESWWEDQPVRSDLRGFLFGYLTSKEAVESPLMILGQPGSGKSLLTKMLAAQLPVGGFLVVRVQLRDFAIETDIQTQIEQSVRATAGETITWSDLIRVAEDALPIVLLDGFDELLQVTGVSQSDYLEKIAQFQEREARVGKATAVVVTSRIAVADRARIPAGGITVVRMEPFDAPQVTEWLDKWNSKNASYLSTHQLSPLMPEVVMRQQQLAEQPLLLLMLALYDADGNALQDMGGDLGQAELYDRLLTTFTERQVRKQNPNLESDDRAREVERQLLRLSLAALGMFNRNRLWITEVELNSDINCLYPYGSDWGVSTASRPRLSIAHITVGQFFFIHQPQAAGHDTLMTASEFLHATFGEFLIARVIAHELEDIARVAEVTIKSARKPEPDDAFLHALLSFVPLTVRANILDFLTELLGRMMADRRDTLVSQLIDLFRASLYARSDSAFDNYQPTLVSLPEQCAVYSVNLLVVMLSVRHAISATRLFGEAVPDSVHLWTRHALLWSSQLSPVGWASLLDEVSVRELWSEDRREVEVSRHIRHELSDETFADARWSLGLRPGSNDTDRLIWTTRYSPWQEDLQFMSDGTQEVVAHALQPFTVELGFAMNAFVDRAAGPCFSLAHALFKLWMVSGGAQATGEELAAAYDDCIAGVILASQGLEEREVSRYRELILRQISLDQHRLPGTWRQWIREKLEAARLEASRTEGGRYLDQWAIKVITKMGLVPQ